MRTGPHKIRWIIRGVAAGVLAAAFLLAVVGGSIAEEPVIDTGASVSATNCVPCHYDLGQVEVPGLIFSHGNHLLVSCDGCHARMPHKDGATEKVPMEVCFACHGVQHGPQGELATGKCADCHTKSFRLRPRSHTKQWSGKPHADAGKAQGVNTCMMCHSGPKDCDECHTEKGVDSGPMPEGYHPVVQPRPKGPSVKIYPDGKVSMAQCVYCHPDLDDITPGRLIFAHAAHIGRNYQCTACHPTFAHSNGAIQKPDMLSCYRCHGLSHAGQGVVAAEDCDKCHPKGFELMPNDHTMKFIKGTHGDKAKSDPAYCAMCHPQEKFCVDCHRGKKTSPNAPGKMVIPKDHRQGTWKTKHGGLYLKGEGMCGACHDGKSCQRCHYTVMPHPVGWLQNHRPPAGTPEGDCNVCHQDRRACQDCHHQSVKTAELTAPNCTPCHDQMKKRPATKIKHKGFAEHAVHFEVDKKKGKPYRCYHCHVDFGSSSAAEAVELQQGHDLRLCYECHGALNHQNALIAPWKGAALCRRCHQDVGV